MPILYPLEYVSDVGHDLMLSRDGATPLEPLVNSGLGRSTNGPIFYKRIRIVVHDDVWLDTMLQKYLHGCEQETESARRIDRFRYRFIAVAAAKTPVLDLHESPVFTFGLECPFDEARVVWPVPLDKYSPICLNCFYVDFGMVSVHLPIPAKPLAEFEPAAASWKTRTGT